MKENKQQQQLEKDHDVLENKVDNKTSSAQKDGFRYDYDDASDVK